MTICTKWTKRCRWYRKRASGVPTRTRHQCRASGRKLWQNSRWHSWFTFINFGAALSFQIQTTIIPGEKMVVIHPVRHSWLESGAESHFFHPMHKPGIFRHTLFYFTMEIRSFTYRFLRRTISDAQLFKYQHTKRNIGQLLYSTLCFFIDRSNIISLCSYGRNELSWIGSSTKLQTRQCRWRPFFREPPAFCLVDASKRYPFIYEYHISD